ncbi:MAG: transcriptional regulator, MerR family [Micrococcaceae bacterium]|nr:transcriptional regulator, MerR family [Micrococcaceae bacterium]
MTDSTWLTAGVFAQRARLSPKALRLYAQNGLLVPEKWDPQSGYRLYASEQLRDARLIRMLRRAGMPMRSVAELMQAPREQRDSHIAAWWSRAVAEFNDRRTVVEHLAQVITGGKDSYTMFPVTTRRVPTQMLLTEQDYVDVAHLSDWIVQAGLRQLAAAAAVGGQTAASIVIYHGDVSEDSDGPVESAVPIDPGRAIEATLPTRVEPAHHEAFVTISRAQIRYPDILSAYDAVEAWITRSDLTQTGPPREYYFADPSTGPEDEPVAHIAFPVSGPADS